MSKLKFFADTLSQPCRAIQLFLSSNKIIHETVLVNLTKGEHLTEEFAKVNPFHKVPVIEHNGFFLTESVAILRYLCREFNVPDHWYPKDSVKQAKVDEYMEWQHANTRLNCAMYFQTKYLKPMITGKSPKDSLVEMYRRGVEDTCTHLETVWLKNGKYLCGNEISLADLLGVCELEQLRMANYDPISSRPVLAAWMQQVRNDLSPHYDTVHARVNKIALKYKGVPTTSISKL